MSRNGNLGEMLQEMLQEFITETVDAAIGDADLSDKVKDEMPDFDDLIEKAVDNLDISSAMSEALDDFDIPDKVEKEVKKELDANLHEYVENEFDSFTKTDKFKELVMAEVNRVLEARDAAAKLVADAKRAEDYVKCGPLRRWLGWY